MPALPSRTGGVLTLFGVNRGALGREMRGNGERGCPGRLIGGSTERLMGDPRGLTGDCGEGIRSEADDSDLEQSFPFSSSDNVSIDLLRSTVND
jgi:hypothetical protein